MARFRYRMENILSIKYKMESQAKADFAENAKKLNDEKIKLKRIYDDIKLYEKNLRDLSSDFINITELKWTKDAIEIKKDQSKKQLVMVNVANKNLELARNRLNEAIKERKIHEKLKEKEFEEFVYEFNKILNLKK